MDATRETYLFLPAWQKGLFYLLIFASLGWMIWQIWEKARVWRKGQPISWKANWIGSVLTYILGQKKVQGSRPKDGAPMHLMIFYGFLALMLATTLLSIAEYGPILGLPNFHKGGYYLVYEFVFDIMGLVFTVGVAWALVRRLQMIKKHGVPVTDPETNRPKCSKNPLSHDWRDLAALVLLLGLGVTGFVVEAARMVAKPESWDSAAPIGYALSKVMPPIGPPAYIAIWWIHALLVCVFFIVLPQMRLRHIVIAVLTAAGRENQPMGELKPVSMESVEETGKIGVSDARDYSRWHLMSLDACMECGRCTEVCPAHGVGKSLNPKQVIQDLHRAIRTDEAVPAAVTEEALWACTTCNACVEACPVLIRHVDLIVDARRSLVAEGSLSGTGAVLLRQVGSTSHAWGQKADSREEWMKGLDIPLARNGVEFDYLFWVGCAGATDPQAVKTTKAVAGLLKKAGVKFACLGKEEACTGDPARRMGDEFLFQEKAGINHAAFAKYKIKKIVTACPHCLNTFKNEYHQFGPQLEAVHHTQLLDELIQQRKLRPVPLAKGEVTYHDPCYLARVNGESDAPRRLVGEESHLNGDEPALVRMAMTPPGGPQVLAEPEHHGRKTLCCGAGGGRMWMEEEPNQRPSNRRAEELMATGAKTVAVSCPFCRIMLDAGLKQQPKGDEIRLVDLAEMLQEANKDSGEDKP